MPFLWQPVVVGLVSISVIVAKANQRRVDNFVMGLVRDLGRYKAKKRRFANASTGVVLWQTLLKQDDVEAEMVDVFSSDPEKEQALPTFTLDELSEYGDGEEGRPILISLFGRVYDVSPGAKFYGPNGSYGHFAGNDVTYSLSTGCKTPECVGLPTEELTEAQLNEGKRWLSFFHWHDKYALVGKLQEDHYKLLVEDILSDPANQQQQQAKNPIFNPEADDQQQQEAKNANSNSEADG